MTETVAEVPAKLSKRERRIAEDRKAYFRGARHAVEAKIELDKAKRALARAQGRTDAAQEKLTKGESERDEAAKLLEAQGEALPELPAPDTENAIDEAEKDAETSENQETEESYDPELQDTSV